MLEVFSTADAWVALASLCALEIVLGIDIVNDHPSMKILALSFLLLIGVLLVAEGLGQHLDKRYIYFAMSFALIIELLNMRFRKKNPEAKL